MLSSSGSRHLNHRLSHPDRDCRKEGKVTAGWATFIRESMTWHRSMRLPGPYGDSGLSDMVWRRRFDSNMATQRLLEQIQSVTGQTPTQLTPLKGGMVAEVFRVGMVGGDLVAKVDRRRDAQLDIEGMMLGYLAAQSALPVPTVIHSSPQLLLMDWVGGESRFDHAAEADAADQLAALHGVSAETYGFHQNTLIGSFVQPNQQNASWLDFFADQRLRYMARLANEMGLISAELRTRVETLSGHLDRWLSEPAHPSLIHGDIWTTNVLAQDGKISAFLDPAIYYGDAEIELSYIAWTGTFGEAFYQRYAEHRPISPNFFTERRHIYSLYPTLVHVLHFGQPYVEPLAELLERFGH